VTLKLDEKFLSNANNIGGALNAITGTLSGAALILGLYAVKIQGDGLEVQRAELTNATEQTRQQTQEFNNSKLFTSLEYFEERFKRVNEKFESKFPEGDVININDRQLNAVLQEEKSKLENQKRVYSISIEYLSAKIEEHININSDLHTSEEHRQYKKFKEWQKTTTI
jgi:hypothetical protein